MEFVLKIRTSSFVLLVSLPANEAMHVPWPRVWKLWQVLGAQFFGTIVLMKFVSWKTRANSSAFLVSLPANETMHVPSPNDCKPLEKSWARNFSGQWHCPENPSSPQAISHGFPSVHPVVASVSLLPHGSSPQAISHGFPSLHPVIASISLLVLPNGALPKLFPTASPPSTRSPQAISHG